MQDIEETIPDPILPGDDYAGYPVDDDDSESEVETGAEDAPAKRKRGRPKKDVSKYMSQTEAEKWDYDSWITSFEWDQPGMSLKVERLSPEMVGTQQTAGTCGVFDNRPMSSMEIQQMYGGGRYHISVIGPRQTSKGPRIMRLSHKPLKIAGQPNLENLGRIGMPTETPTDKRAAASSDAGVVGLLGNSLTHLQRQVGVAGQQSTQVVNEVGRQYQQAAEMKAAAADQMLKEKDRLLQTELASAQRRVDEARAEAQAARKDREGAMEEARRAQQRIYDDRAVMEEALTKKLESVHSNSNALISTLLPQVQSQAQNQINMMMSMFESRLSAAETSYQSRIENLDRSYQQRMEAQSDLYKAQMETSKQMSMGQIQHLQIELQTVRAEKQQLQSQLDDARNRLMEEIQKLNSAKDPEQQMVKFGSMIETFKGLGFGGKEESDEPAGSGNPFFDGIMANIGKVAEIVPHITGAITAKAQAESRGAMMQPMLMQQQQQQPMQMQPQPQMLMQQPQAQAPAPAPAPQRALRAQAPARPKKAKGKISRDELDKAVLYINAALSSNPEIDPNDFANVAVSSVDNAMLRQLSRQKSELVVNELETMGVLHGNVSTAAGKAFLVKLLDILRSKL